MGSSVVVAVHRLLCTNGNPNQDAYGKHDAERENAEDDEHAASLDESRDNYNDAACDHPIRPRIGDHADTVSDHVNANAE